MIIGITTNISAGIGLATEYRLLKTYLEELGHTVHPFQFDEDAPKDAPALDLMISLETVCRHLLDLAPVNWLCPNPEWTKHHDLDLIGRAYSKILCKTREGEHIFKDYFPGLTHYVGFIARDQFDPSIPREKKFLHIGGNSSFRGTQEVLDAWRWKKNGERIGAELIIVSKALSERPEIPNVQYIERVDEDELRRLQNACRYHLYPSGTEGFGHAIREAMSVNASILTTAAPPMDEIKSAHKVQSTGWETYNLAKVYQVSALDIHVAAKELLELDGLKFVEEETREEFLRGNEFFRTAFAEHLEDFVPRSQWMAGAARTGKMRISFLGNFAAEHSTENQILWALEQGLGHTVECIQENEATLRKIDISCRNSDVFLWVRTPGWLKVEDDRMIDWLQTTQVKTASIHLDKFFSIPDREALIGVHPFWKTSQVWTADGSRQEDFAKRGVSHFWMKPAASEEFSHPGRPRDSFRCDVGFVGAKDYHQEHQFRNQMIEFLQSTYGQRFKLITGGVRGHELNDFYASCRVCVGDCFGGGSIPRYWSDRMVETPMRYGFLLSPKIEGLDIPLATYTPGDLKDLKSQIDYWLLNETERRNVLKQAADHVRMHDTWTVRMAMILEMMGK